MVFPGCKCTAACWLHAFVTDNAIQSIAAYYCKTAYWHVLLVLKMMEVLTIFFENSVFSGI
jgi:hypothetical protein